MTSKRFLASLLFFFLPSLSWAYVFDVDWRDFTSSNYGRAHLVAVNVFLAICQDQGVTLSETSQTLLSGSFTGNLSATKNNHTIYFNYPYTNDRIQKRLVLWPIQQTGNDFRCAYYFLAFGYINGSLIAGTDGLKQGFCWSSVGECTISNIFTGDISVTINNHTNHFPAVLDAGSVTWMSPNVRDINLNYDSINTTLVSQRIRPGAVLENRSLFNGFGDIFYLSQYASNNIFDFSTWTPYSFGSAPAPFNLIGTSNASSSGATGFFSLLQGQDTDAGSEPDLHEFYSLHLYTYPEDDWTYSGEDYPEQGGGSGAGGQVTGYTDTATSQMEGAISDALGRYFGDDSTLDDPTLDQTGYTSSADDIELDETWLSATQTASSSMLPSGASTFQNLVNRLKTPNANNLPKWRLNFEVNTGSIAGKIWEGVHYDIDFGTLKNSYPAIFTTLRTLAVICMFVSVIIYIIKDNLLLGGNPGAGSEES